MFCSAQDFDGIEIDEALVCDSVSWLLENQRQDGAFPEVKDIIHKSMMVSYIFTLVDIGAFVRRPKVWQGRIQDFS